MTLRRCLVLGLIGVSCLFAGCGGGSTDKGDLDGGSDAGDAGDDGGGTVILDDAGTIPVNDAGHFECADLVGCSPIDKTGCDDGKTCRVQAKSDTAAPLNVCADIGLNEEGDKCAQDDECMEGLTCQRGACRRICCVTSSSPDDACPADQYCLVQLQSENGVVSPFGFCEEPDHCNLLEADSCSANGSIGCYPSVRKSGIITRCIDVNAQGVQGESCAFVNDCAAGYDCVYSSLAAAFECRRFCDLSDDACTGDLKCHEVNGFPDGIGVCSPKDE